MRSDRPKHRYWTVIFFFAGVCRCGLFSAAQAAADDWPAWRGPQGNGVTRETDLPTRWSKTDNVRWRVELPEPGNSTPIVWQDRVYLTQPVTAKNQRTLMCFDRASGKLLWQVGPVYDEPEETHATNPYCSPSAVTDGERVVAWFGSAGLYCYDLKGRELWRAALGKVGHEWGAGSSPVLTDKLCIVNFGPGNPSFVIAVDKKTGKTAWRFDVPHEPVADADGAIDDARDRSLFGSWGTPLVAQVNGQAQLILGLPQKLVGCNPRTGKEIWRCGGLGDLVYACPLYGEGVAVALGGYYGPSLAVRPDRAGDLTSQRLWHVPRSKLRLGSGVIRDGHLYVSDMQSIAECVELESGKMVWQQRLPSCPGKNETWSSMVLSGDRIYLPNQSGDTFVYKAQPKFELIATNSLGESTNSSPAISDGEIFLRTHQALWCIGGEE